MRLDVLDKINNSMVDEKPAAQGCQLDCCLLCDYDGTGLYSFSGCLYSPGALVLSV